MMRWTVIISLSSEMSHLGQCHRVPWCTVPSEPQVSHRGLKKIRDACFYKIRGYGGSFEKGVRAPLKELWGLIQAG